MLRILPIIVALGKCYVFISNKSMNIFTKIKGYLKKYLKYFTKILILFFIIYK